MNLLGFAAKNALRNRFRTSLTVAGVAVTVFAFIALRTVIYSWNIAAEFAAKDRIASRHKVSFVVTLPKRYIDIIREVDGVKQATYLNWFGAKYAKDPNFFFANFLVDPKTFLEVFDEVSLSDEDRQRWLEDRQGAVIGSSLAKQLKAKVGDKITLEGTIFPGNWTFNVAGIYKSTRKSWDQSSMMMHWDYINESLDPVRKDQIGWTVARIDDPGRGPAVSQAIDKVFEQYDNQTLTMSERALNLSFMGMFTAILTAVNYVSIIILVILLMILANTIAMGMRERTSEYGALRALGFTPGHIRFFIVGESVTMGIAAGVLGVAIAWPALNMGVSSFLEQNMGGFFPYFRIDPMTIVQALILSVVLGAAAGVVPAIQAGKLSVVNALRRVE